jgi:hypothetical protein
MEENVLVLTDFYHTESLKKQLLFPELECGLGILASVQKAEVRESVLFMSFLCHTAHPPPNASS